jgi:Flp pilus assembly pilin Flp
VITLLRRFVRETTGQDIVEYGLLAAFIGLVGVVAWANIKSGIGDAYSGWGSGVNQLSICTPDPGDLTGTSCAGGS